MGTDPVAVDATCARIMGLEPTRLKYLREAGRFLGNTATERILQRGELPSRYETQFEVLDHLKPLRLQP
jgi:uncharacterized protein (DUF362 family)